MFNIALCDDEEYMQLELAALINDYFKNKNIIINIVKFSDGESLLNSHQDFDVIFLDIQMNVLNGMDTAKALRNQNYTGLLIFITILEEYVFDSFEVQTFDYILKPPDKQRFIKTMERAFHSLQQPHNDGLLIQKNNESRIISLCDILFCEVINRKVFIHTIHNEIIDYYDKMDALEKKLDTRFFRCHRSYLVNLKHVKGYKDGLIHLLNGDKIPISRLRAQEFSNTILQYMKNRRK